MYLYKFALAIVFAVTIGTGVVLAQDPKTPSIAKGVFWADPASGVEVYLIPVGGSSFRLAVVTRHEVKVTYRTSINSVEAVVKELPIASDACKVVKYFIFDHHFSKMTIWVGLDFAINGKPVPALTRAFYNTIYEPVPPDMFLGGKN